MFCAALPFLIPFLKSPEWGFFYFACFSKNGRNHSGEWFDFEKKVLKTSIKSMHGQQTEK